MDRIATIVVDAKTGLLHGALMINVPTPSGCDRWQVRASLKQGHLYAAEAAEAAHAAFPDAERLDVARLSDADARLASTRVPAGVMVTTVSAKGGEALEGGQAPVEIRRGRERLPCALDVASVERLARLGYLRIDSTSGDDPDLHYVYDHYVADRAWPPTLP